MVAMLQAPRATGATILAASFAILGATFALQYLAALEPCPLCVYQRYPYAVTLGLSAVALALTGRTPLAGPYFGPALTALCGIAFTAGAGIAAYHVGVEQGWFQASKACTSPAFGSADIEDMMAQLKATPVARCDQVAWSLFGVSLAGYNLIASAALAGLSFTAAARQLVGGAPR
jgi:disulfide bond formation protein DsbB